MKNEKVCINKSIAFIVAVVVLLLGVVLFANYMNSQNYGTASKAAGGECQTKRCTYGGSLYNYGTCTTDNLMKCVCDLPTSTVQNPYMKNVASDPSQCGVAKFDCSTKQDYVETLYADGSCRYYTGSARVDYPKAETDCVLAVMTDKARCDVAGNKLKAAPGAFDCSTVKDEIETVYTNGSCRYYSGFARVTNPRAKTDCSFSVMADPTRCTNGVGNKIGAVAAATACKTKSCTYNQVKNAVAWSTCTADFSYLCTCDDANSKVQNPYLKRVTDRTKECGVTGFDCGTVKDQISELFDGGCRYYTGTAKKTPALTAADCSVGATYDESRCANGVGGALANSAVCSARTCYNPTTGNNIAVNDCYATGKRCMCRDDASVEEKPAPYNDNTCL